MTSPNFDPLYSTDNIWLKADEDTCLSDHLDDMASDIASKAPTSHTHSGYATADHTHTGYATSDHTHTGYAESSHTHTPASIGAAPESHSHDYAASSHGHAQSEIEGLATALNGKAAADHSHTGFAAASHSHNYSDLSNKPTIPTIPASLPANGGNADTVDGKHASDFAAASHTHSYAASSHSHSAATTSAAGFMSTSDKSKLDGIATGANKTTVDSALSSSSTNPVQNKVINAALAGKAASNHTHDYAATNHTHGADVITAHLEAVTYSVPVGGTWTNIPLTNLVLVGNSFALIDNQIRIGAGVSKVMISAQICVGSSSVDGNKYMAIRKNASQDKARTQIRLREAYTPETMCIPSLIIDVAEGDLLTIDYSGTQGDAIYGELIFTYLTVQKIA